MIARPALATLAASLLAACAGLTETPAAPGFMPGAFISQTRWIPAADETYQIQYSGKLDLSNTAAIYDLDRLDRHL